MEDISCVAEGNLVYIVDEGILRTELPSDSRQPEDKYDRAFRYDGDPFYVANPFSATTFASEYVTRNKDDMLYAVVSETYLDDEDYEIVARDSDLVVCNEEYDATNVIYSVARINGKVIENFIKGQQNYGKKCPF